VIVRILGEGQFRLPDNAAETLNAIDERLEAAVASSDEAGFTTELAALVAAVRSAGSPLAEDELVGSDAVVPDPDTTLDEARSLLSEEGLIPD
jgi:methylmalonyl-CoA mutase cobalamin-binding subunit